MSTQGETSRAAARRALARLILTFAVTLASSASAAPEAEQHRLEAKTPMRDGTLLATTIHLPPGDGPWPSVLARTPYNKNGLKSIATKFNEHGFAFVAQDCRGKFESEGEYEPFRTDHIDGYDTIEWVAKEEWSDGMIGMYGGSALGITAHLAATQSPPHLRCAYVIVASASARNQTVFMGGAYRKEMNDGWLMSQGAAAAITANVRNPAGSRYWDWREIPAFHSKITIPIYEVGGWFDIFSQGAIDNFVGLQSKGSGLAAGNQKLLMGPYAHGRMDGDLEFPDAHVSEALLGQDCFRWFARWLKNERNGIEAEPPVRYYVLGDPRNPAPGSCVWRTAMTWPPSSRPTSYFLQPQRGLSPERAPVAGGSTSYSYDPKNPVPTTGGANLILGGKGPVDQRLVGQRQDYLRFASPPLESPLEISGRVYVDLFVASDAIDTDFAAKLVDVYPDGYEALILDGILRCRYRNGIDRESFLTPGEATHVRIDLWSTSIVLQKGHRLAVHVTSSNDPRFDPNPNTGKPLRADRETRIAQNTVYHSTRYPSRILLPVISSQDRRATGDGGPAAAVPAHPAASSKTVPADNSETKPSTQQP